MRSKSSLVCLSLLAACASDTVPETAPEPARLSACWVETAQVLSTFTASGILVRHPDGDALIDAGNSTRFDAEVAVYTGDALRFMEDVAAVLKPQTPLPDALSEMGVEPGELSWLAVSHVHVDHLGGLMDLPDLPVLLHPSDMALVTRGREEVLFEVVPAHAERTAPLMEPLAFDDGPFEIFDESEDVFGDGSVVFVPLPGHTPGSVGIYVDAGDGAPILHVGDAVSSLEQLDGDEAKSPPLDVTDHDPAAALETVHVLHRLANDRPDLRIVPAHDRRAWSSVFGTPGGCIGG